MDRRRVSVLCVQGTKWKEYREMGDGCWLLNKGNEELAVTALKENVTKR